MSWLLRVGTRIPSTLDPNEEERVQVALLFQKAWMFAWLVNAEPPAETIGGLAHAALEHPFQVQLSSIVRNLGTTATRVLCALTTRHI